MLNLFPFSFFSMATCLPEKQCQLRSASPDLARIHQPLAWPNRGLARRYPAHVAPDPGWPWVPLGALLARLFRLSPCPQAQDRAEDGDPRAGLEKISGGRPRLGGGRDGGVGVPAPGQWGRPVDHGAAGGNLLRATECKGSSGSGAALPNGFPAVRLPERQIFEFCRRGRLNYFRILLGNKLDGGMRLA